MDALDSVNGHCTTVGADGSASLPTLLGCLAVLAPCPTCHHVEERTRQEVAQVDGDAVQQRTNQHLAVTCTDRLHDTISHRVGTHSHRFRLVHLYHMHIHTILFFGKPSETQHNLEPSPENRPEQLTKTVVVPAVLSRLSKWSFKNLRF